jgi:hypothetical protein
MDFVKKINVIIVKWGRLTCPFLYIQPCTAQAPSSTCSPPHTLCQDPVKPRLHQVQLVDHLCLKMVQYEQRQFYS